jgi:hypothetical protein
MSDIVNIELALPSPIRIVIGEDTYTISGDVSFRDGLRTNQLLTARQDRWNDSQAAFVAAQVAREVGAPIDDVIALAEKASDAVIAYEEAGDELLAHLDRLLKAYDPKQSSEKLSTGVIDRIAGIVWSRAMGADDATLEAMGDKEENGAVPPPNRSTRRNGSTASAKRTAAGRRNGSTSR